MKRLPRLAAALLAAVGLVAGAALPASAARVGTENGHYILGDREETIHLDWTGGEFATVEASFVGTRVIVPGDRVEGTLHVVNEGPSDAVMTVAVLARHDDNGGSILNARLGDYVDLFWQVNGSSGQSRFAELSSQAGTTTTLAQIPAAQGATQTIRLGFEFPADVTEHYRGGLDSKELAFDLLIHMAGDADDPDLPGLPGAPGGPDGGGSAGGPGGGLDSLPVTGGTLTAAFAAAALLLAGVALLRRRREDPEAQVVSSTSDRAPQDTTRRATNDPTSATGGAA